MNNLTTSVDKRSVSIRSLRPLLNFAVDHSADIHDYLKHSDLTKADIQEARVENITVDQEDLIYQNILNQTEDRLIGLKLGSYFKLESYGALGFTIMSSKTVGDSIDIATQYHTLTFTRSSISKVISDNTAGVKFTGYSCANSDVARVMSDRDLSASKEALSYHGRLLIPLSCVCSEYASHDDLVGYSEFFGCEIELGCDSSQLHFDKGYLNQLLPLADHATYNLCKKQCDANLSELAGRLDLSFYRLVYKLISEDLNEFSSLDRVASNMRLNPRTLRRKLKSENTSFQQILQMVRTDKAKQLLSNDVPVNLISEQLGYSEPANFSNAFKKWTGVSPRAFIEEY